MDRLIEAALLDLRRGKSRYLWEFPRVYYSEKIDSSVNLFNIIEYGKLWI